MPMTRVAVAAILTLVSVYLLATRAEEDVSRVISVFGLVVSVIILDRWWADRRADRRMTRMQECILAQLAGVEARVTRTESRLAHLEGLDSRLLTCIEQLADRGSDSGPHHVYQLRG